MTQTATPAAATPPHTGSMEARVQRVLILSGPLMMVMWIGAFLAIAGFIPPSDPSASADTIARMYTDSSTSIKVGMVIAMAGCAFLVPFGIAISGQLKRIRGAKALADVQMVSCALLSLEFITPIAVWMATSYRAEGRSAEVTQAMHDLGWILFMTVIWSLWVQLIAVGVAILLDRSERPALPRWLAYLSLWEALLILPAGTVLFFKDGPFAWNGAVGLYVPLVTYSVWILSTTWCIHRALGEQVAEGTEPG
ncbi:hypothetical protein ASD11_00635 [Aeromicrobium sp. Root495]|uniref:hypothetical protein n=1 Tax=Aeromicrobium sp. Root495 TaxID=1736550 RepID=UPI0006FF56C9|nr:hypothetical protein [Aeromicrobium sp. Root495]KQY58211.1 hypothetical protein ASD11_00635 [Aeromicrobium sp. Root495]